MLGFIALIVLPDEFAVVHAPLVRVAHVVVGAGVLTVQTLTEEVIFYFYFLDVSRGLAAVRLIVRHDVDISAHPGSVIVIDSWLALRVRLGSYNTRTRQMILAIIIYVVRVTPEDIVQHDVFDVTGSRRVVSGHGFNVPGNTAQRVGDGVLDVRLAVELVVVAEWIIDPPLGIWFDGWSSCLERWA